MAREPDRARAGGQHRSTDLGRSPYRLVALTLLLAVVATVAAASVVLRRHSHSARLDNAVSADTRTAPAVQSAEAWLSTNLPRSAKLIADPTVRAALIHSGFPSSAVTLPDQIAGCEAISYVVITRALQSAASTNVTLAGCVRSAMAVAVFSSGTDTVRIAETVPAGSDALATQRTRDSYDRTQSGVALATNPAVGVSAAVRTSLTSGRLDLRAATVVAVLASRTHVRITAVTGDPAELAAGLPARTVEVVLTDAAALAPVLASLSEPFRPSAMVPTGRDSFRLAWSFATAPIPQLN